MQMNMESVITVVWHRCRYFSHFLFHFSLPACLPAYLLISVFTLVKYEECMFLVARLNSNISNTEIQTW